MEVDRGKPSFLCRVSSRMMPRKIERHGQREMWRETSMAAAQEIVRTTCPRDCYDTCGIAVIKRDGVVRQVRGDPDHPVSRGKLCAKCSAAYTREWLDRRARLTRPLRRVGTKGTGQFEPISWEIAISAIAERLKSLVTTVGAQAIVNAHYTGTISLLAFLFPL